MAVTSITKNLPLASLKQELIDGLVSEDAWTNSATCVKGNLMVLDIDGVEGSNYKGRILQFPGFEPDYSHCNIPDYYPAGIPEGFVIDPEWVPSVAPEGATYDGLCPEDPNFPPLVPLVPSDLYAVVFVTETITGPNTAEYTLSVLTSTLTDHDSVAAEYGDATRDLDQSTIHLWQFCPGQVGGVDSIAMGWHKGVAYAAGFSVLSPAERVSSC